MPTLSQKLSYSLEGAFPHFVLEIGHGLLLFLLLRPHVSQTGLQVHVVRVDLLEAQCDSLLLFFVVPIDLFELVSLRLVLPSVPLAALLYLPHQVQIVEFYLLFVLLLLVLQIAQLFSVYCVIRGYRLLHRGEGACELSQLAVYLLVDVPGFLIYFLFVLLDLLEDLCLETIVALFIILLDAFEAVAHRLLHILDLPQHLLCDQ